MILVKNTVLPYILEMMMKKLAGFLVCLLFLSSVGAPKTTADDRFYTKNYSAVIPACSGPERSVEEMEIRLSLLHVNDLNLARFVYSVLYNGYAPDIYADNLMDELKLMYKNDSEDLLENLGMYLNYEYNEEHNYTISDQFIVIRASDYLYFGGAHGAHYLCFYVIDMAVPEILTLSEIISVNNYPQLKKLIERELRLWSEEITGEPLPPEKPLTDGIYFEDDFDVNDFCPDKDGIHFWWNVYDLTAYAFGPVEIVIGWNELGGLLDPKGVALARAFGK